MLLLEDLGNFTKDVIFLGLLFFGVISFLRAADNPRSGKMPQFLFHLMHCEM